MYYIQSFGQHSKQFLVIHWWKNIHFVTIHCYNFKTLFTQHKEVFEFWSFILNMFLLFKNFFWNKLNVNICYSAYKKCKWRTPLKHRKIYVNTPLFILKCHNISLQMIYFNKRKMCVYVCVRERRRRESVTIGKIYCT